MSATFPCMHAAHILVELAFWHAISAWRLIFFWAASTLPLRAELAGEGAVTATAGSGCSSTGCSNSVAFVVDTLLALDDGNSRLSGYGISRVALLLLLASASAEYAARPSTAAAAARSKAKAR